ncbi:MAG TPA: O-antigen ligase family protein [Gallicola sp.]|nr:O-antigen ligase family protein [Gallicola sp.]
MSFTYGALIAEIIISLIIMTIVSLEFTKNANKLVRILLNITLAYSIIGLLNSVNIDGRLMNESMGNALPLNTVFIVFYSGFLYFNKKLNSRILIAVWLLSISLIVLSGARKALGASLIIITFYLVAHLRNISFKTIISLVLVIFIFTFAFNYISDDTVIGARIAQTIETGERVNTTNIQYLNFLGDRAQHYILAFELFLNNKLTGVGLRNFSSTTLNAYTLHSEYMVQLAECGIIGTSFFLLFNGWILINLVKLIKKNRAGFFILGALLAILFINLTAWTYSSPMYFASYGIVIGYIKTKKNDNCNLCR